MFWHFLDKGTKARKVKIVLKCGIQVACGHPIDEPGIWDFRREDGNINFDRPRIKRNQIPCNITGCCEIARQSHTILERPLTKTRDKRRSDNKIARGEEQLIGGVIIVWQYART
jgi:hypothetical protein